MKNIHTTRFIQLFSFVLLITMFSTSINGQGWRRSMWTSGGGADDHNIVRGLTSASVENNYYSIANAVNDTHGYVFVEVQNTGTTILISSSYDDTEAVYLSKAITAYSADTTFALIEKTLSTGMHNLILSKFHKPEETSLSPSSIWERDISIPSLYKQTAIAIQPTADGNYIVLAYKDTAIDNLNQDIVLIKITPEADVLWTATYEVAGNEIPTEVAQTSDGGYIILKNVQPTTQAWIVKVNGDGGFEWENNLSGINIEEAYDITPTSDGNFVITGTNRTDVSSENPFFLKIDESGSILWRRDYDMPGRQVNSRTIREDFDGNLVMSGSMLDDESGKLDFFLIKATVDGIPIWEKNIGSESRQDEAFYLSIASDGGYLLAGYVTLENSTTKALYYVKTDVNGVVKPGFVWGNVFNDVDENCLETDGDIGLNDWTVRAYQDNTSIFYTTTDEFGNYEIPVDTGDYVVSVLLPNGYWLPCYNDSTIHLSYLDTINIDFPIQMAVECPLMTVDMGITTALRPCEAASYVVNYCNSGTALAEDVYVEITIDSLLVFNSASITPTIIDDNVYTFELGDLASAACESFSINVTVSCDSTIELGQVFCTSAHIYPDSLCLPELTDWEGALLQVNAICDEENELLRFQVENIGNTATTIPRNYVIIEDAILLMQGSLPEVGSGEVEDIPTEMPLPANGSTYHLYVQQEPGAPYAEEVSIAVEGCGTNEEGGFS